VKETLLSFFNIIIQSRDQMKKTQKITRRSIRRSFDSKDNMNEDHSSLPSEAGEERVVK